MQNLDGVVLPCLADCHAIKSVRTIADSGLLQISQFQKVRDMTEPYFAEVQSKLRRHFRDAQIWKDACLLYFQQFSRLPIPYDIERPVNDLEDLMKIDFQRLSNLR